MQNYYNPYYQQPVQQTQNNGFISVRNEVEARNYPVAPGNSITFKDETSPYVYTKTMGFSQLDRPIFEKFKLVKEDVADNVETPNSTFNSTEKINELRDELDELKGELDAIKAKLTTRRKKDVGVGNDEQSE